MAKTNPFDFTKHDLDEFLENWEDEIRSAYHARGGSRVMTVETGSIVVEVRDVIGSLFHDYEADGVRYWREVAVARAIEAVFVRRSLRVSLKDMIARAEAREGGL